ncbi:hypothetical protein [Haloarchaeobius sp. TZWWS8]|uniref:hypothetical protein n=1 Tax=Haloarchaeobius sp. TZWWS8 TaxID=3446121 RepID=UPI003EBA7524
MEHGGKVSGPAIGSANSPLETAQRKVTRRSALGLLGTGLSALAGGITSSTVRADQAVVPMRTSSLETREDAATTARARSLVFTGTASTRFQNVGYTGTPQPVQTVSLPARVIIGSPVTAGGQTETNPFSMLVTTGDLVRNYADMPEGSLFMLSAHGVLTPETQRKLLLQYWTYQYDARTGVVQGTLTSDHLELAAAMNTINANKEIYPGNSMVFPYVMAEGTTLQGTVEDDRAILRLRGDAQGVRFDVQIQAQPST